METSDSKRAAVANPWSILALLALALLISFVDRTSLSSALADKHFVREFGLTSVERGWLNSAFFWSYAFLQVPAGYLVDRYGVKGPYAIAFVFWSLDPQPSLRRWSQQLCAPGWIVPTSRGSQTCVCGPWRRLRFRQLRERCPRRPNPEYMRRARWRPRSRPVPPGGM